MIKGQRVYLKLIERSDISRLYDICSNIEVNQYNNALPDKKYLLENFHIISKIPIKILSIVNEKNIIIGVAQYLREYESVYRIGFAIDKMFWGRGYGHEVIETMVEFLFKELDAEKIVVEVMDKNKIINKCIEDFGFIREDEIEKECSDIVRMVLLKDK